MAEISATMVKQLREKTGSGMMDCKKALVECDGDMEKAVDFLRKKGLATAQKRAGRAMTEGTIQAYIHMGGKLGVLVEINCETDFVARNEDFKEFSKNIAMHIAASNPLGIRPDDITLSNKKIEDKTVEANVYLLEHMGSKTIIDFELENSLIKVESTEDKIDLKPGDKANLVFNNKKMHIFDKKTEKAIS